ncbi:MAG: UBX domain-containing protein 6 [Marteilia pararefringens]
MGFDLRKNLKKIASGRETAGFSLNSDDRGDSTRSGQACQSGGNAAESRGSSNDSGVKKGGDTETEDLSSNHPFYKCTVLKIGPMPLEKLKLAMDEHIEKELKLSDMEDLITYVKAKAYIQGRDASPLFKLLTKYLENIKNRPGDQKCLIISAENKLLNAYVLNEIGGRALFEKIGFKITDDNCSFIFDSSITHDMIEKFISHLSNPEMIKCEIDRDIKIVDKLIEPDKILKKEQNPNQKIFKSIQKSIELSNNQKIFGYNLVHKNRISNNFCQIFMKILKDSNDTRSTRSSTLYLRAFFETNDKISSLYTIYREQINPTHNFQLIYNGKLLNDLDQTLADLQIPIKALIDVNFT